jgi:cyanophycin synthetase
VSRENVEIILSETEALEKAMLDARPGDMIVLFYEELEPAIQVITKFKMEQEKTNFIIENSMSERQIELNNAARGSMA